MLPKDQLLCACIRQAQLYDPNDTRNRTVRRAAYYAEDLYYKKVVTEKYPLDRDRAIHHGQREGSYLSKSVIVITDSERAAVLWRIRQLYKGVTNDNS